MVMGLSAVPLSVRDMEPSNGRHHGVDVIEAFGAVEAGVDQDGVAGLRSAFPDNAPIAEAGAVVGLEDAGEAGFLAIALVVGGINVEGAAGLWRAGARCGCVTLTVWVVWPEAPSGSVSCETAFVLGAGNEIEDGSSEAMGDGVVEVFAVAEIFRRRCGREGGALRHADSPTARNWTATVALRLESPEMAHSKPRLRRVGCSTWKRPAVVAVWAASEAVKTRVRDRFLRIIECALLKSIQQVSGFGCVPSVVVSENPPKLEAASFDHMNVPRTCYHITRKTMMPCQRPVPMSENEPRVPLKVPKLEGSVAL